MTGPATVPFHSGLTPDTVIDAAVRLSAGRHLFRWSIRDLAGQLGVAPSVIYHHVGGKDLLCRHVVERVVSEVRPPSARFGWARWFRTLLLDLRPILAGYPGTAKWLLMHGPTFPALLAVVDGGVEMLRRAGFGDRIGFAYGALINTALLTISITDDRLDHEGDGPRDHAAMMDDFRREGADSEGLSLIAASLVVPFVAGADEAEEQRDAFYRFMIDTVIAGLGRFATGSGTAARPSTRR
ncbi:TetR/AcrR family transcriptional regulator [Microlunatus parietis]|uniref:AcrR family transcriptional regulator n=1 Tax=Microlunatus parietis TaxID=682979 RepID=A0A7Y9I4E5_9ACTN|nr:TetR/AcrR family transcriptional regulator C-terminal domain-containing protein [Microlunatus parietis]NYE69805.1 AcrR family transcriptional regulator [Microlunatus parietis]